MHSLHFYRRPHGPLTSLAVPLAAIAMVVVLFDRRATGGRALPPAVKAFVLLGAATLLGIALMMYVKLRPQISEYFKMTRVDTPSSFR